MWFLRNTKKNRRRSCRDRKSDSDLMVPPSTLGTFLGDVVEEVPPSCCREQHNANDNKLRPIPSRILMGEDGPAASSRRRTRTHARACLSHDDADWLETVESMEERLIRSGFLGDLHEFDDSSSCRPAFNHIGRTIIVGQDEETDVSSLSW